MSATYLSHAENVLYNMDLCFLPLRPRDLVNSDTCYCTLKTKNNIKLKKNISAYFQLTVQIASNHLPWNQHVSNCLATLVMFPPFFLVFKNFPSQHMCELFHLFSQCMFLNLHFL